MHPVPPHPKECHLDYAMSSLRTQSQSPPTWGDYPCGRDTPWPHSARPNGTEKTDVTHHHVCCLRGPRNTHHIPLHSDFPEKHHGRALDEVFQGSGVNGTSFAKLRSIHVQTQGVQPIPIHIYCLTF